jgi:hypothetical protein
MIHIRNANEMVCDTSVRIANLWAGNCNRDFFDYEIASHYTAM